MTVRKTQRRGASTRRRGGRARRRGRNRRWRRVALGATAGVALAVAAIAVGLDVEIQSRLEGRVWTRPSVVYSAPTVLVAGDAADREAVVSRLERTGYGRASDAPARPGEYRLSRDGLVVYLRELRAPGVASAARIRELRFGRGRIRAIRDASGRAVRSVSLDPEELARFTGPLRVERDVVPLESMPEVLLRAVLAIEDARFRDHAGVDPRAIARAAWVNVRSGRVVQGGSTIPQQTVKNLYLTHRRTWWRKLREIPMAVLLDLRYSKDRILEVYLNEVYLGQRGPVAVCGVEAASKFYFGRSVRRLDLSESALLAGLIRSPGRYNPFRHPERAVERRDQVLDRMVALDWVDAADAESAKRRPLRLGSGESGYGEARYVVDRVRRDLAVHLPDADLEGDGLVVHTSIDTRVQALAERALAAGLERLERGARTVSSGDAPLEGAVVVTRPSTGEILAWVGGRDYGRTQFDRALSARRQPGSLFKPIVYLAAFERGMAPSTRLLDRPVRWEVDGKVWQPANHDRTFRGPVTARVALETSLNVPTVRAARDIGVEAVVETARRCGVNGPLRPYPAVVLGTEEVTPIEMAAVYGTFANGGVRTHPHVLREVWSAEGEVVARFAGDPKRVVSAEAAFLLNDALTGVLERGTGRSTRTFGYDGPAAGKTGTTDGDRDAWFAGYTPGFVGVVWVGRDDGGSIARSGAVAALPVWAEIARGMPGDVAYRPFRPPPGVVRLTIDSRTGGLAVSGCADRTEAWFAADFAPRHRCEAHAGGVRGWFRKLFRRSPDPDGAI